MGMFPPGRSIPTVFEVRAVRKLGARKIGEEDGTEVRAGFG
jgi:hypothetical protein